MVAESQKGSLTNLEAMSQSPHLLIEEIKRLTRELKRVRKYAATLKVRLHNEKQKVIKLTESKTSKKKS